MRREGRREGRREVRDPYANLVVANWWAALFHVVLACAAVAAGVQDAPFTVKFDRVWNSNMTTPLVVRSPTCSTNTDSTYRYQASEYREWLACISPQVEGWRAEAGSLRLYSPVIKQVFEVKVWVILFIFCALTSLSHFVLWYYHHGFYSELLNDRQQPLRWLEYSATSSLMILVSASLSNVTELYLLVFLVMANMFMQLGGLVFEALDYYDDGWPFAGEDRGHWHKGNRMNVLGMTKWFVYGMSWLVFAASFSLIFDAFYSVTQPYFEFESGYLWEEFFNFIKIINWTLFCCYFTFPIIHFTQVFRYVDYATAELLYIAASLVAKGGLVAIYLAAAVARE